MPSVARVERCDEVIDSPSVAPIRPFDQNRYDIEANLARGARVLNPPGSRGANHAFLLSPVHRQLGRAIAIAASGLDLDEGHDRSSPRDQIDLDPAVADVSRVDAISSPQQEGCGTRFSLGT
jgi:hypothetical protein